MDKKKLIQKLQTAKTVKDFDSIVILTLFQNPGADIVSISLQRTEGGSQTNENLLGLILDKLNWLSRGQFSEYIILFLKLFRTMVFDQNP